MNIEWNIFMENKVFSVLDKCQKGYNQTASDSCYYYHHHYVFTCGTERDFYPLSPVILGKIYNIIRMKGHKVESLKMIILNWIKARRKM